MALSMKNFNILEVHWKIQLLDGRFMKNQYRGGNSLKRGTWIVSWFKGWELGKKEGSGVFEGWLIIQCTLWFCCDIGYIYIYISRNYFHILTKAFKYIIPFFNCDISQSPFEILNQNFIDIPQTKRIEKKHW